MDNNNSNSRRKFLKNTGLGLLGLNLLSTSASAKDSKLEDQNEQVICDQTTNDLYGQGPFYTSNAPTVQNNQLASSTEQGEKIILSGRVFSLDCSEFITNTEIDIWHANDDGQYDNSGFNLRGKTFTNSQGFYLFETIKPGLYLNQNSFRPSHIHFKITPPGFSTLITQLYFEGDPHITNDAAASINSGEYDATHRIIPLTQNSQGVLEGTWDIVINGEGTPLSLNELHLETGMIYNASPSPFNEQVTIQYGIFKEAKVGISVFDLNGRKVADLEESNMNPGKYEVVWQPQKLLSKGYYFIALKINDIQVHYTKVLKA